MPFAAIEARLDAATTQAEEAADLLDQVATGPASGPGSIVEVSPGVFVKTVAKAVADIEGTYGDNVDNLVQSTYTTLTINVSPAQAAAGKIVLTDIPGLTPAGLQYLFSSIVITDTAPNLTDNFDLIFPNKDTPAVTVSNNTGYKCRIVTEDTPGSGTAWPNEVGVFLFAGQANEVRNMRAELSSFNIGILTSGAGDPPQVDLGYGNLPLSWKRRADGGWGSPTATISEVADIFLFAKETTVVGGVYDGEPCYEIPTLNFSLEMSDGDFINFGSHHIVVKADVNMVAAKKYAQAIMTTGAVIVKGTFVNDGVSIMCDDFNMLNNGTFAYADAYFFFSKGSKAHNCYFRFNNIFLSATGTPMVQVSGNISDRFFGCEVSGGGFFVSTSDPVIDYTAGDVPDGSSLIVDSFIANELNANQAVFEVTDAFENFYSGSISSCVLKKSEPGSKLIRGVDSSAANWLFNGNLGIKNTDINATIAAESNATSTTNVAGPTPILGATDINDDAIWYRSVADGSIVYVSSSPHVGGGTLNVSAKLSGGAGSNTVKLSVLKNGQQIKAGTKNVISSLNLATTAIRAGSLSFNSKMHCGIFTGDFTNGSKLIRNITDLGLGSISELSAGATVVDVAYLGNKPEGNKISLIEEYEFTGDTTNGSTVLKNIAAVNGELAGVQIGSVVVGSGVPVGAAVVAKEELHFTGDLTSGSPIISNVTDVLGTLEDAVVGDALQGTGIPVGAVISSINTGTNEITMDMNATSTEVGTEVIETRAGSLVIDAAATATAATVSLTIDAPGTMVMDANASATNSGELFAVGDTFTAAIDNSPGALATTSENYQLSMW